MSVISDLLDKLEEGIVRAYPDYQLVPLLNELRKLLHVGEQEGVAEVALEVHAAPSLVETVTEKTVEWTDSPSGRQVPTSKTVKRARAGTKQSPAGA